MQKPLRVLIAPDSFKGSATNKEVSDAISRGWKEVRPYDEVRSFPMADGGEGTLETFASRFPTSRRFEIEVNFYEKQNRLATWLLLDDGTAIIELAEACGLIHMKTLAPLKASTFAFGKILKSAAENPEVKKIIACVGGSASTDGGVGALIALGARFLDKSGNSIELGGEALKEIYSADFLQITKPPLLGSTCLVDVNNFLIGENGAARIYAPQKGASEEDIKILEVGLQRLLEVSEKIDFPGAGAAGGTSFGLNLGWGSSLNSGAKVVAKIIGLREEINESDIVITGEGRFDQQSAEGKVVGLIQELSEEYKKKVLLCVGSSALNFPLNHLSGVILEDLAGSKAAAMSDALKWLDKAGKVLALQV
ncbi:MAG: glycerate kinase [Actinomycetes bacterium]